MWGFFHSIQAYMVDITLSTVMISQGFLYSTFPLCLQLFASSAAF